MALSGEDELRLNVLLAQELHAVRIDESKMMIFALTAKGEVCVALNTTGKDEAYIKEIKALLSAHVMGSPGGYPVYLKRWTRMGQARDESLAHLLLLGEPEAVVAVVYAAGLTDTLAARAWWAMPTAENARRMLAKQAVVEGETGKVLADFLVEFLPFEEEQSDIIESVRLVLQPGLITQQEKEKLWLKTKTKRGFYIGFLHACADDLPLEVDAHPEHEKIRRKLSNLLEKNNRYAVMLEKVLSKKGQAFIKTVEQVLKKPANQDVAVSLLDAVANYFESIVPANTTPEKFTEVDMTAICSKAALLCRGNDKDIGELISAVETEVEDVHKYLYAMTVLASLNVKLLNPIFARTDAIGTVMRKKIKPITDPVFEQLSVLRN